MVINTTKYLRRAAATGVMAGIASSDRLGGHVLSSQTLLSATGTRGYKSVEELVMFAVIDSSELHPRDRS